MFGERLKILRINRKMSQKELAERLNITKSVISFYESGERMPSYEILIKISDIFHVSTDYLLGLGKKRTVDVSELSESNIALVVEIINALKNTNNN